MKTDSYSQLVFDEDDIVNLILSGHYPLPTGILVDKSVDVKSVKSQLDTVPEFIEYTEPTDSIDIFDYKLQSNWYMPDEYKKLDIAEHVLKLCVTQEELQRAGEELLLFQDRNLFDLLKFLKYLVDTMKLNGIIWGVGRGSSVSSYVLYLLGVHRINSMYYDLDIQEFLR
jgi:DNA polymerase III alpha subunit